MFQWISSGVFQWNFTCSVAFPKGLCVYNYIYIYIYTQLYIYMYIYIYICIHISIYKLPKVPSFAKKTNIHK